MGVAFGTLTGEGKYLHAVFVLVSTSQRGIQIDNGAEVIVRFFSWQLPSGLRMLASRSLLVQLVARFPTGLYLIKRYIPINRMYILQFYSWVLQKLISVALAAAINVF